jgi:hypothetical protein
MCRHRSILQQPVFRPTTRCKPQLTRLLLLLLLLLASCSHSMLGAPTTALGVGPHVRESDVNPQRPVEAPVMPGPLPPPVAATAPGLCSSTVLALQACRVPLHMTTTCMHPGHSYCALDTAVAGVPPPPTWGRRHLLLAWSCGSVSKPCPRVHDNPSRDTMQRWPQSERVVAAAPGDRDVKTSPAVDSLDEGYDIPAARHHQCHPSNQPSCEPVGMV